MTFEVADGAREDLVAAIRFYNSKPGRYGAAMRAEFKRAAKAIAANPRLYSPVEDDYPGVEVREFLIGRFDQRVIFTIERNHISIIAVIHATRQSRAWHRRLHNAPPPEAQS